MKKGVSPILSAVLLFAVTVSVVGIFSQFAPRLVGDVTERAENQTQNQITCESAGIEFLSATYDSGADETTVSLRNGGSVRLENVIVAAFDTNQTIINQTSTVLYQGNLTSTVLQTASEPDYLQAFSQRCDDISVRFDEIS